MFRGPHLVSGGGRAESRGILETKREIKELRDRIAADRDALAQLAQETAELEGTIAHASNAIAALNAEHHKQEKAVVGHDAQLQHADRGGDAAGAEGEQLAREKHQAEEERDPLDRRQEEARLSIARLDEEQRQADERLTVAQRRLFEAREAAEELSRRAAEAGAAHAALVERAGALAIEVVRLEEAGAELEERAAALAAELDQTRAPRRRAPRGDRRGRSAARRRRPRCSTRCGDVVMAADEAVTALRGRADEHEAVDQGGARRARRDSRRRVRARRRPRHREGGPLAPGAHLRRRGQRHARRGGSSKSISSSETGTRSPMRDVIFAEEQDEDREVDSRQSSVVSLESSVSGSTDDLRLATDGVSEANRLSAEEAITALRGKIERLGPVNMMAIEQFDELETRHLFLTTSATTWSIRSRRPARRSSASTRPRAQRFVEAFAAINTNFQQTFSTLFGGGRAGLTLLDENDPLESGIEIIAQPPGKRLQSVQLLSGGEKALTAIALMFAMFKFKPSPFCVLDEIDAPLDDANIGRFVEMLRGMQQHTQFIVITHSRKTMEIADRLYGVTMEEPGVSKLISVQLN